MSALSPPSSSSYRDPGEQEFAGFDSTVYGPVKSWRFGWSLGIDLILRTSTCSFDCVYCQLGPIEDVTPARRSFVPTSRVVDDLREHGWEGSDVATFSGSGEPTLALNLGEALAEIARISGLPTNVLTNGTTLGDPAVVAALAAAARVELKVDAVDEETFRRINRPVEGVTLAGIVADAVEFRATYHGHLALQVMVMPATVERLGGLSDAVRRIRPDSVHLNTPRRPRPREFHMASRGSHARVPYPAVPLRPVPASKLRALGRHLEDTTGVEVSVGDDRTQRQEGPAPTFGLSDDGDTLTD